MVRMNLATAVVLILIYVYIFWRIATIPAVKRLLSLRWRIIIPVVLFVLFYTGRIGYFTPEFLAVLLFCFLFLLATDIISGFGFFMPRYAGRLRGIVLSVVLLYCAAALVQGLRPPVIKEYEVYLDGLPAELDSTVVAVVSDTHVDKLTAEDWMDARVAQVLEMHPDLIVLLGDLIDATGEKREKSIKSLQALRAPLGVWAVLGNHESYRGVEHNIEAYEQAGLRLLRNDWTELRPGLVLTGVEYMRMAGPAAGDEDNFYRALVGRPEGATILLCHAPVLTELASSEGVGLMLSGHTHNGQIWPLGYIIRRWFPLVYGRYELGNMTAIVSGGAGCWQARMRLWRPGEILRITLRCK